MPFAGKETQHLFETRQSRRFSPFARVAIRKLTQLDTVKKLEDLSVPPGNRLEALKHSRQGQHSIRVNEQFRICFRWGTGGVYDVEIVDYH